MSFASTKDIILFALAIYGALLSTWNLIQAIRKEARSIRVTAGSKIPVFTNGEMGKTWVHLEATNIGQRPVTVTTLAFELGAGRRLFNMQHSGQNPPGLEDTALPITLADGQTARLHYAYSDIAQALLSEGQTASCKLTPICEDSAGGIHRGEAWNVDPREWMRM
jgi:hypothetical protein